MTKVLMPVDDVIACVVVNDWRNVTLGVGDRATSVDTDAMDLACRARVEPQHLIAAFVGLELRVNARDRFDVHPRYDRWVVFIYAGDAQPGVNEAQLPVQGEKTFGPELCSNDLFVASARPMRCFYCVVRLATLLVFVIDGRHGSDGSSDGIDRGGRFAAIVREPCVYPTSAAPIVALIWNAGIQEGTSRGWVIGDRAESPGITVWSCLGCGIAASKLELRYVVLLGSKRAAFHVFDGRWAGRARRSQFVFIERFGHKTSQPRRRFFTLSLFLGVANSRGWDCYPPSQNVTGASRRRPFDRPGIRVISDFTSTCLPSGFTLIGMSRHGVLTALTLFVFVAGLARGSSHRRNAIRGYRAFTVAAMLISYRRLLVGILPSVCTGFRCRLLPFIVPIADAITPLALACIVAGLLTRRFVAPVHP